MSENTNATIRLVSAGTGRSIPVSDGLTVAELRDIANLSPDISLFFNGDKVTDEDTVTLSDGDTLVSAPAKIGHGI
jgi:hypothetical protein